jgi:hypothetical protein
MAVGEEMTFNNLINKLCDELPDGCRIVIECENGYGGFKLFSPSTHSEIDGHLDDSTPEEMTLDLLKMAKEGISRNDIESITTEDELRELRQELAEMSRERLVDTLDEAYGVADYSDVTDDDLRERIMIGSANGEILMV